eukprot:8919974-Alexandrium_andersonii.AAC.1
MVANNNLGDALDLGLRRPYRCVNPCRISDGRCRAPLGPAGVAAQPVPRLPFLDPPGGRGTVELS